MGPLRASYKIPPSETAKKIIDGLSKSAIAGGQKPEGRDHPVWDEY
jgi:hypothetical protein